jgi:hypothetical protein
MKTLKTLSCALAVAMAFVAGKAMAHGGNLILNVSGTSLLQKTDGDFKGTTASYSFTEKNVYEIISNAVANAGRVSTNAIPSVTLPSDGYIVFNPGGYDGMVYGTFYVTNKSGVYHALSGFDTNDEYYSFIELDTTIYYANTNGLYNNGYVDFGFWNFDDELYQGAASYSLSKTGSGSDKSTSKALLYIHDYPYDYGDPNGNDYDNSGYYGEDFYPFDDDNENAAEIGGILTATLTITDNQISNGSFALNGSGNLILFDYEVYGVVSSGHASFAK